MSEKRKDSKGRILKTGESERKDGVYMYRYNDAFGKRVSIYAGTLSELREKEAKATEEMHGGYNANTKCTVADLVDSYIETASELRPRTLERYRYIAKSLKQEPLAKMQIKDVRVSHARSYITGLSKKGLSPSTAVAYKAVLSNSFQRACDDDILPKNPFLFRMAKSDKIPSTREALTREQQAMLLDAFKGKCWESLVVLLLHTGLRIGEALGLTIGDIDFGNKLLHITKQLAYVNGENVILPTKTKSGCRVIPLDDEAINALRKTISSRSIVMLKPEQFVFINSRGNIARHNDINAIFDHRVAEYNRTHDEQLPHITPHILRHTFCTNMSIAGMNIKTLQYIMGHASASVTMDIYTHARQEDVVREFRQIVGE